MTACTKAPEKKFLWLIPYTPECDYELDTIFPWAFGKYEVWGRCKWCGARRRAFGVVEADAMFFAKQAGGSLVNGRFEKDVDEMIYDKGQV